MCALHAHGGWPHVAGDLASRSCVTLVVINLEFCTTLQSCFCLCVCVRACASMHVYVSACVSYEKFAQFNGFEAMLK